MLRIHIRLNFEHEAGEGILIRVHDPLVRFARLRLGRIRNETVQHVIDAEVAKRGAEKHWRRLAAQVRVAIERMARATHEFDLFQQRGVFASYVFTRRGAVEPIDLCKRMQVMTVAGRVAVNAVQFEMIDATKVTARTDRPGDRRALNAQHGFNFIEQCDRLADFPIELVDECQDRRVAQPADVHQFDRARLYALRRIDDHQRRIDSRQRSVRVFGEVLVAGRVEQVHDAIRILELHHRGRNGNAPLALHRHPVGGCMSIGFTRLDGSRQLNRVAEQQQFFGYGGLARIGVRDDRERATGGNGLFHGEQR